MERGTVLIVDDDANLTFILRAHLNNANFNVHVCHDGAEACAFAMEHRPDVILLDVGLPGMDGLDVTRTLRADPRTQKTPIILLTGRSKRDDVVLGLDAGAQDYVTKPFDMEELTARVRSMHKLSCAHREIDELNGRLTTEVRQKTAQLEMLYTFVRELNRAQSAERVYDLIIETVQRATGCRRVSIMRYDPLIGKLVCKRALGMDPQVAERVSVDATSGIAGQVFTTGRTVLAQTMGMEATGERQYASDNFLSTPLVSTYMMSGEQRLGVLNVTDKPDGAPFTPDETEALCSIADSAAIALHNVEQRLGLSKAIRALLLTVGRLSEYRDEETGLHLERVQEYARILSRQLAKNAKFKDAVTPTFIDNLSQAAPLHDLGKVGIPDEILNKPGKLTDEEFQIMKTHTTIGRHTLMLAMAETGPNPLLEMCVDIAYCHHERYDGRGYPRGIAGEEIPLAARIISLVDAYDAITSQRCYKPAVPHNRTVEIIRNDAGTHFDPDVAASFLEVAEAFDVVRAAKADEIAVVAEAAALRS